MRKTIHRAFKSVTRAVGLKRKSKKSRKPRLSLSKSFYRFALKADQIAAMEYADEDPSMIRLAHK